MYKDHPTFDRPSDDTILWRYMDFTKFISLLEHQALFFAKGDRLGDQFEGSLSKANSTSRRQFLPDNIPESILDQVSQAHLDFFKQSRRSVCVNCWHESQHESAAMWKIYAKEGNGIAIRTQFNGLAKSFVDKDEVYIGRVRYINYEADPMPETNVMAPYMHKRQAFEYEQEVRAVILSTLQLVLGDDLSLDFVGPGIFSKVDLTHLIGELYISPYSDEWFEELVQMVATRYGLLAPVRKSSLADEPTWE